VANVTVSPQADLDLLEIGLHIARDNPRAADQLIDTITARFDALARTPGMGVARDELLPGLRMFPVRGYLIFYHPSADGIEVVRVLSGRRDVEAVF
jgi:toxin ParE1/3/4